MSAGGGRCRHTAVPPESLACHWATSGRSPDVPRAQGRGPAASPGGSGPLRLVQPPGPPCPPQGGSVVLLPALPLGEPSPPQHGPPGSGGAAADGRPAGPLPWGTGTGTPPRPGPLGWALLWAHPPGFLHRARPRVGAHLVLKGRDILALPAFPPDLLPPDSWVARRGRGLCPTGCHAGEPCACRCSRNRVTPWRRQHRHPRPVTARTPVPEPGNADV